MFDPAAACYCLMVYFAVQPGTADDVLLQCCDLNAIFGMGQIEQCKQTIVALTTNGELTPRVSSPHA